MRRVVVVLGLVMAGCASGSLTQQGSGLVEVAVPVRSRYIWGQVCPISETEALTAEHVSSRRVDSVKSMRTPLTFEIAGVGGTLLEVASDLRRDLSRVEIQDGPKFIRWFERSDESPKPGDWVLVQGYDYEHGAIQTTGRYQVLATGIAGSFTYNGSPGPGSSGSCAVLERSGELVGVNTSLFDVSAGLETKQIGTSWSVWGAWGEIPEKWRE